MTIARPGRVASRFPRALALLFVFALALAASVADRALAGEDPPVVRRTVLGVTWETIPAQPCADREAGLRFRLCECQVDLLGASIDPTHGLVVRLRANPEIACVTCVPDSAEVRLGALAAGMHAVRARFDIEYVTAPPDSTWPKSPAYDVLSFAVAPTCSTGGIPYLERVVIGRPAPCLECPPVVCPGDSIDVFLSGTFPDDCTHLESVELFPSVVASPLPQPPMVRITYGTASCLGRPCVMQPQPWAARVRLPGLPAGDFYRLPLEAYLHDHCTPHSIGTLLASTSLPFTVADSCDMPPPPPPTDRCFNVGWYRQGGGIALGGALTPCTAPWRTGRTTELSLAVGSHAPIAGVQGALRLENAGALRIVEVGALLRGWQVARSRAPDGGDRFIAFAGPGAAPIPGDGRLTSFLSVVVEHNPLLDVVTPSVVHLAALDLLVSDPNGIALPGCPTPAIHPGPNVATLCREARCDANSDGRSDVRDLVVMVNCLNPPSNARLACPDSSSGVLDCDRNGAFDLDDVFCCVRSMLVGGMPPDSGSTGGMRDAPGITARFGVPQAGADGVIDVPLYLGGMSAVAAGRLDVAYPDTRYDLFDVTFDDAPASWWTIHDASGGRARLALIDLAGLDAAAGTGSSLATGSEVRAILRLKLRAGATPGGELAVTGHDFAAGDGVGLSTPNAAARIALAGAGSIALSAARPNPFTGSTAFALTLPTAGAIDVAVFAANGRRVATLLRESAAAAGVYDLAWDGRQDAGGPAPAGVYFVRVTGGASDASRKVLYLPGGAR